MKKYIIICLLTIGAVYNSYAQSSPGFPTPVVYKGPLTFYLLDGGGMLIHCENLNHLCAKIFAPKKDDPLLQLIGEENTMIAIYDNPESPDKPRNVIVKNSVLIKTEQNGSVSITCQPPNQ